MTTTPAPNAEALAARLRAATEASINAAHAESEVALVLLASALKDEDPDARYLSITWSDQGTWISAGETYDEDWNEREVDPPAAVEDAAMCLYDNTADTWGAYVRAEENEDDDEAVGMFLRGAQVSVALDLAAILHDADKLAPAPAEDHLPAILFASEAAESWGDFFHGHPWAATFTLNDGTEVNARVTGQGSRPGDGFVGVEFWPIENPDETWDPDPTAADMPEFLACDEFVKVVLH